MTYTPTALLLLAWQVAAEAQYPHVRTYDTLEELQATCQHPRCTMALGHNGPHYDGVVGQEVAP